MPPSNPDILIIGAGFSGLYALHTLRTTLPNLTAHILEAAPDIGGVWHWNRYPGARVDSEWPFYQLTIPSAWRDFYFTERFPDHREIRRYFAHLDEALDLKRDITFNARVNSAVWDEESAKWIVKTESGLEVHTTYLLLCSGLLHRPYIPAIAGMKPFLCHPFQSNQSTNTNANDTATTTTPTLPDHKPQIYHSSSYPQHLDTTGKRVAVIGAGATGVQIVQDLSKTASHLTLFMRRPSPCLPMKNRPLTRAEQDSWRPFYPALFDLSRNSALGFPFPKGQDTLPATSIFEVPNAKRDEYYESLWKAGSFNFGARNFPHVHVNEEANRLAYDFWAKKTRQRISDPVKREILAPEVPGDFMFTRRVPLETDFYESVDRENVDVVRVKGEGVRFSERGGVLLDGEGEGEERVFDIVVLATGFDSFNGALTNMNIHGRDGLNLTENWQSGIKTYMGITMHGFPNCFMSYSPHSPTPVSNGPTIIEAQISLITSILTRITQPEPHGQSQSPSQNQTKERLQTIEPLLPAQSAWRETILSRAEGTLYTRTDSWWNGANVPGKKKEMVTFLGGVDEYVRICRGYIEGEGEGGLVGFRVGGLDKGEGGHGDGVGNGVAGTVKSDVEDRDGDGNGNGKKDRFSLSGLGGLFKRLGVVRS